MWSWVIRALNHALTGHTGGGGNRTVEACSFISRIVARLNRLLSVHYDGGIFGSWIFQKFSEILLLEARCRS